MVKVQEPLVGGWFPWADVQALHGGSLRPAALVRHLPSGAMICFGRFGGALFVRASSDIWTALEDALAADESPCSADTAVQPCGTTVSDRDRGSGTDPEVVVARGKPETDPAAARLGGRLGSLHHSPQRVIGDIESVGAIKNTGHDSPSHITGADASALTPSVDLSERA